MGQHEVSGPCPECDNATLIQEFDDDSKRVTGNHCPNCEYKQKIAAREQ